MNPYGHSSQSIDSILRSGRSNHSGLVEHVLVKGFGAVVIWFLGQTRHFLFSLLGSTNLVAIADAREFFEMDPIRYSETPGNNAVEQMRLDEEFGVGVTC